MASTALKCVLLALCLHQVFGLYSVEIQLLMSQGIECSTCSGFDSSGATYKEWTVNPGNVGDLIANISLLEINDSLSYSVPLCCKYLFSQDELAILQNNTDLLTQINLSFHRWAEFNVTDGSTSVFDYAYNVGLYNNTNGQILYANWQTSDINSNTVGQDSASVFTSSVNNPEYTNKVKAVYIIVGYQVASNVDATVNFANVTVSMVFDDTERLRARAISYGVGLGVGFPVFFLIVFLPIYFRKIRPRQLAKLKQQKDIEAAATPDKLSEPDPKYGAISATPRIPSERSTAELLATGNYSPLGPITDVSAPGSKSKGNESKDMTDRFNIPYKEITFKREIGAGGFGKVFMGEWQSTEVAIKVSNNISSYQEFRKEAELMVNIRPHPNVLQVLGVCTDGVSPAIIMEYCPGGSLDLLLFDKSKPVTAEYQFRLILGIARGMLHLHKNNIVHRDLAARNILLSRDGEPKISDFGMSRIIESSIKEGTTRTNVGPIRWMAPESIKSKKYSTKSDVWSFGIVISEILNREEPHSEIEDVLEIAMAIRNENRTPKVNEDVPEVIKDIMKQCWAANPDERPEMDAICDKLIKHKEQSSS